MDFAFVDLPLFQRCSNLSNQSSKSSLPSSTSGFCPRTRHFASSPNLALTTEQKKSWNTVDLTPYAIKGFPNTFNNNNNSNNPSPDRGGEQRLISELVDFPCVFTFKIIGLREGDFIGDICDSVSQVLRIEKENLIFTFRDKGKYQSITLEAPCNSADQVYSVYAAIDKDPRVKFKF